MSTNNLNEGNDGITSFVFYALRIGDATGTLTADWQVIGKHSVNAFDFIDNILPAGTVEFSDGETKAIIKIDVEGDKLIEEDEQFTLTSSDSSVLFSNTSAVSQEFNESAGGGFGVTNNYYLISSDRGSFSLNYNMYDIRDQADIYVNSALVASTNKPVSGMGTLTIPNTTDLVVGDLVKVVMTGTDKGTGWDYSVHYKGGATSVDHVGVGVIVNDDFNNLPTGVVTITGDAEQGKTLIVNNTLADADGLGAIHYSWLADGQIIGKGDYYAVATDDVGKKIYVIASYTDGIGVEESVSSAKTGKVSYAQLILHGTAGNEVLDGDMGNDKLYGDAGNDTLNGGGGKDILVGNLGDDVENGGDGNDVLYSVFGNNTLEGGMGNDVLISGKGYNILTGGEGADSFQFSSGSHSMIADFVVADDTIKLENKFFTQFTTTGFLDAAYFKVGAKALDSNDYLIYNSATGALSYDADGSGAHAAIQIAVLGVNLPLTHADFVVT